MTDFKTLLKFENEEEVRDSLEHENKTKRKDNQIENDLTKDDLHKAQNYSEADEEVNKGKQESKGKESEDLDNDCEEISDEKKALPKSKKGVFYLKLKKITLKVKKMIEQKTGENISDSNLYFSPTFCCYLLNNWCGIPS